MTDTTRNPDLAWAAPFVRRKRRGGARNGHAAPAAVDAEQLLNAARRVYFGIGVSTTNRLGVLLDMTAGLPPELFWPVFLDCWSDCDDTAWEHQRLLRRLRQQGTGVPHLSAADRAFYDTLPSEVTVYRGCSRPRVRRVSWTTERPVAESFARGHRNVAVPDAVVATAVVPRAALFGVSVDRNEHEVLVDPDTLRKVRVKAWRPTKGRRR